MKKAFAVTVGLVAAAFHFGTLACAQDLNGVVSSNNAKPSKDKEQTCRLSGMVVKMADELDAREKISA